MKSVTNRLLQTLIDFNFRKETMKIEILKMKSFSIKVLRNSFLMNYELMMVVYNFSSHDFLFPNREPNLKSGLVKQSNFPDRILLVNIGK